MHDFPERQADFPIEGMFLARWSPRHMTGEALPLEALMTMLEAARWAPSSGNGQPWRFAYALAGTADFARFLGFLSAGNQGWASRAGALMFLASQTVREKNGALAPNRGHAFDAGAAWMSLALQASALGWHAHAMGGVDFARATSGLDVPATYQLQVAIAVGRLAPGDPAPKGRVPLSAIVSEGRFVLS